MSGPWITPAPARTAVAFFIAVLLSTSQLAAQEPVDWQERLARQIPGPEEVVVARSAKGVAATLHMEASQAAVDVLEAGGNAMDAAVAAWLVLAVVTPNQTGLAGGGHINYYDALTGQTYIIDAAQRAGMEAHPGVFLDEQGNPMSAGQIRARGLAVGVPGVLRGLDVALKRFGTRYFDELAGPAIRLAEEGWQVDRELSLRIHQTQNNLDEYARSIYMPDGEPLEPGALLVQADKARALRLLAEQGPAPFYQGEVAEATAQHVRSLGGVLTLDDFRRFNVTVDPPLRFSYGDYEVATHPNIPGGYTVALILKLLEPLDLAGYPVRSAERYHLILEATRIAAAVSRRYVGGAEFMDQPWRALLSDEYVQELRAQIQPDSRLSDIHIPDPWAYQVGGPYRTAGHHPHYEEPAPSGWTDDVADETERDPGETDHLTIADRYGNVVAITTSLGVGWIGGHMVPDYGFMLNVRGAYFSRRPGGIHEVRPGKRPRRSMAPTMVFRNGEPVMTVGSPSPDGMQHVQVLLNVLEHGLDPASAVAEPRVAPAGIWEQGVPAGALEALRELGHPMNQRSSDRGAVPILVRDGDAWIAASDPRRDGVALGVR